MYISSLWTKYQVLPFGSIFKWYIAVFRTQLFYSTILIPVSHIKQDNIYFYRISPLQPFSNARYHWYSFLLSLCKPCALSHLPFCLGDIPINQLIACACTQQGSWKFTKNFIMLHGSHWKKNQKPLAQEEILAMKSLKPNTDKIHGLSCCISQGSALFNLIFTEQEHTE